MKRLLAIVAFLAGGIAAELAHPVQCHLIDAEPGAGETQKAMIHRWKPPTTY